MKLIAATALAVLLSFPVQAQQERGRCATFNQVSGMLLEKFGETPVETRTVKNENGVLLYIFSANAGTRSWTFLVTDGYTMCILAEGDNYAEFDFHAAVDEVAGAEEL